MKALQSLALVALACGAISCGSTKSAPAPAPAPAVINLGITENAPADKYANMEYGIRLNFTDDRANQNIIHAYDASTTSRPYVSVNPTIASFVPESMRRYMRTMGFNLDADVATDYLLEVTLKEFHVDYLSGIGWSGTVMMSIKAYDHNRTLVYPSVEVAGRATGQGNAYSFVTANAVLNKAYTEALKDVDWDRIAFFLHRANSPKDEATKQVKGEGNTALEHLVVHWNVNSRPQGADVYWRVISQTPEVKNQNYKYLETTPYEGSETLNIKGLTYNNAGLVQVEIKCEKTGYYTQTKKYDLLSLVDENDVSYMFRLVKEEE
ncbi:MAG: hypothetical protein MJZ92_04825 [Paludibacteraceae bacterium]|nr:hypothetical protein [Paludibacteraceae bacterium]